MKKYFWMCIYATCIVFAFELTLFAQTEGAVQGIVAAKADRSLLAESSVRLEGRALDKPRETTSDGEGRFRFQRLVPGDYTIVASHREFREERLRFTLKPREIQNVVLELSIEATSLSIQVTGPEAAIADTFSPSSTALEKEMIDRLPADQRNNLPDLIVNTAPGMIRSHDDFVHVRGNEIALNTFINGVSFWENPHSVFSAGISPDIIQSANVMTGGFPAEYGNRFGGVIDIVTKSGFSMDNEGSLTLSAGTALRHNAAVEYGGHTGKAAYYVYGSAFESARFLSPNDPRSIHDTGRGARSFLQLDFDLNPTNWLKFTVMSNGTNFQIPKTSLDDQFRPNANASQRTREESAVLTWTRNISKDVSLTTSIYQRWSHAQLIPGTDPLASFAATERSLFTSGLKSDLTRFFGRHILKGGIDLVMLRPDENMFFDGEGYIQFSHLVGLPHVHLRGPNRGPVTFSGEKTGGEFSGYLQDSVQVTRGLTLDAGLRYDRYTLAMSAFHFSPRLNLAYRFSPTGAVLHASYNRLFVPPAVENVLISSAGLTRFLQDLPQALPALKPIVEDQFELGISRPFTRQLSVGVTGYYRVSDNPVHTVLFPDSRIYAYANFDRGKAYGMEVKVEAPRIEPLGLSGRLNYALSRVYFWNPVTAGFVDETHHLTESGRFLAPMDQTHTLNAGLTYRHRQSGWWAGMAFEYGSGTPTEIEDHEGVAPVGPVADRVPGHFTQNVTIGYDLRVRDRQPWIGLQFNIENLTNNVYKVSQESVFSPGEYFNPRFFSGSIKVHF